MTTVLAAILFTVAARAAIYAFAVVLDAIDPDTPCPPQDRQRAV